jgi:hypothetical protein
MLHRIARGSSEASLLAFAAAQLGCTAEVGFDPSANEGPTASVASATNGNIHFDNASCRPFGVTFLETNLQAGLTLARQQLDDPLMAGCMENAFLALNHHSFAERFLPQMRAPVNTVVRCDDLTQVNSSMWVYPRAEWPSDLPAGTTEYVVADFGFAGSASTTDIAAVFLHEVAHTKDFIHPNQPNDNSPTLNFRQSPDYQRSVPEQFLACSRNMSAGFAVPNGFRRDLIAHSTTLAPVGGAGGQGFERLCQIGTGLRIQATDVINAVGLNCSSFSTPMAGGPGGMPVQNSNCLSSERLVGVQGSADNVLTSLGALCASTTSIQMGRRNESDLRLRDLRGNSTGTAFRRWCPAGMIVSGLRGNAGALVDRLEVDCVSLNNFTPVTQEHLAQVGGNGGTSHFHKCAGFSAMTALHFQSGWDVDRLGGECSVIAKNCPTCTESTSSEHMILVPSQGGFGGAVGRAECPPGAALVGLDLWWTAPFAINGVRGQCANVTDWHAGNPFMTPTARAGRDVATLHQRRCRQGFFLTGWNIRSSGLVDAVSPICRNF